MIRISGVAGIYISHDGRCRANSATDYGIAAGAKPWNRHRRTAPTQPQQDYTRRLLHAQGEVKTPQAGEALVALFIDNISARYHAQAVLQNVSLTLPRGRTLAVIGESGSGKSTLGKVICGLLSPEAGEVSLERQTLPASLRQRSRTQLRDVQLIHQIPDTALNPKERVGRQIARVLACFSDLSRSQRDTRVSELLGQVGLHAELAERFPSALSGGQKHASVLGAGAGGEAET